MTEWNDLSNDERTAIRQLALGYSDVAAKVLRQLAKLGLVEDGPYPRLTVAGFELQTVNPPRRKGKRPAEGPRRKVQPTKGRS